jgi:hypothetical protein
MRGNCAQAGARETSSFVDEEDVSVLLSEPMLDGAFRAEFVTAGLQPDKAVWDSEIAE